MTFCEQIDKVVESDNHAMYTDFKSFINVLNEPVYLPRRLVRRQSGEPKTKIRICRRQDGSAYLRGGEIGVKKNRMESDLSVQMQYADEDGIQTEMVALFSYARIFAKKEIYTNPKYNLCKLVRIVEDHLDEYIIDLFENYWRPCSVSDVSIFELFSSLLKRENWRFETAKETKDRYMTSLFLYEISTLRAAAKSLIALDYEMFEQGGAKLGILLCKVHDKEFETACNALIALSEYAEKVLYDRAHQHFIDINPENYDTKN